MIFDTNIKLSQLETEYLMILNHVNSVIVSQNVPELRYNLLKKNHLSHVVVGRLQLFNQRQHEVFK